LLDQNIEFRNIRYYEEKYEVSSNGEVKSLERRVNHNGRTRTVKERVLATSLRAGYKIVKLNKDGKQETFYVHRLVADAFISNPDPINKKEVNHKDGNKLNNDYSNLEWCTHQENMIHAFQTGLIKRRTKRIKLEETKERAA
jgi:hypothetical protein